MTDAKTLIEQQAAEIERLTAEREALREDAERYRWIRDRRNSSRVEWDHAVIYAGDYESMDAAIDAARKDAKP